MFSDGLERQTRWHYTNLWTVFTAEAETTEEAIAIELARSRRGAPRACLVSVTCSATATRLGSARAPTASCAADSKIVVSTMLRIAPVSELISLLPNLNRNARTSIHRSHGPSTKRTRTLTSPPRLLLPRFPSQRPHLPWFRVGSKIVTCTASLRNS